MTTVRFFGMTYRELAAEYKLLLCTSAEGCKENLSGLKHTRGYFDNWGILHWDKPDIRITRKGLRPFLKLVAGVRLKHWSRHTPAWKQLHEQNAWAYAEAKRRFNITLIKDWSRKDRERAARLAARSGLKLRSDDPTMYQWTRGGQS